MNRVVLEEMIGRLEYLWQKVEDSETNFSDFYVFLYKCKSVAHSVHDWEAKDLFKDLILNAEEYKQFSQKIEIKKTISITISKIKDLFGSKVGINNTDNWGQEQERSKKTIYFMPGDFIQSEDMMRQITCFGYNVIRCEDRNDVADKFNEFPPSVIIANTTDVNGDIVFVDFIKNLGNSEIPIVYISNTFDLYSRLCAVRANGAAFFHVHFDIHMLIDKLDELAGVTKFEPYKILIVDDSKTAVKTYSKYLNEIDMNVRGLTDPFMVLEMLETFHPDLILLDLNMPGCSGQEVLNVLKQHADFFTIPVVFLSSETDEKVQLEALKLGGEDFLNKSITADKLLDAVRLRANRHRKLKTKEDKDSMTSLYNHAKITERLQEEIEAASIKKTELSVVMLDIDHFKRVNDTYGHAIGDSVIKGLSRFLKDKIGSLGIVGRYGGEEFTIILPEVSPDKAKEYMDKIRISFSQISFFSEKESFRCSFSAGISHFPMHNNSVDLIVGADDALYAAKNKGRNNVVIKEI